MNQKPDEKEHFLPPADFQLYSRSELISIIHRADRTIACLCICLALALIGCLVLAFIVIKLKSEAGK